MQKYVFFIIMVVSLILIAFSYKDNPKEPSTRAELGEQLFFDPILSLDSTLSCATCHKPEFAFADTVAITPGVGGVLGTRNAPSVMNMLYRDLMFFDGRARDLRHQVRFPIEDPLEMNLPIDKALDRLSHHEHYKRWFLKIYGEAPSLENLSDAIASFEETLETGNTAFDRYMMGDNDALSASAKRGHQVFVSNKAKCFDCHFGPDFTGDEFKNIGLYDEVLFVDKGRFLVTGDSSDLGRFKVPGLRNIAVTGPYMHDGSMTSLREVIDYYDNPFAKIAHPINIDTLLQTPMGLTEQEKTDLENFLISLTDKKFLHLLEERS
jgi:cytochrome c peroxidase